MKAPTISRRNTRLLSLAGVLVALAGLVGYWFSRDVARAELSDDQRQGQRERHRALRLSLAHRGQPGQP